MHELHFDEDAQIMANFDVALFRGTLISNHYSFGTLIAFTDIVKSQ